MIIVIIAVAFVVLTAVAMVWVVRMRRLFCVVRLKSLSMASRSDSVGGVGVSLLLPSPVSVEVVISLLDSEYPLSEVVVAIDGERQKNLLSQLKIRYSLAECSGERCNVYRSRNRCYRRLVVVVVQGITDRESLLDAAAQNALYDYLLATPSSAFLLPFAVGRMAEEIGERPTASVDCITTTDSQLLLLSRRKWRAQGGFSLPGDVERCHIAEPLIFHEPLQKGDSLTIERSRYNFGDFLALVIMKYQKKVLPLQKP